MPRKTIAGLEATIADQEALIGRQKQWIGDLQATPANVYLSYEPTGNVEVDCVQVVARAINSLTDPVARRAVAAWVRTRYLDTEAP